MKIKFTKMHGIGNDFAVLDGYSGDYSAGHDQPQWQPGNLSPAQIRQLADRHLGIGFDQLLLVEASALMDVDFRYRIFNADGGEVEQCGNGARCFVRFVHDKGLTQKQEIKVETASGIITLKLENNGLVTVNMGAPHFAPAEIPFIADTLIADTLIAEMSDVATPSLDYDLDVAGRSVRIAAVSMGNPHAVQQVNDVDTAPVAELGPLIEAHVRFPQRVNAGFMQIVDQHSIRLRVFERGSGETLACGTGACAAVVAGIRWGQLKSPVEVAMRGGNLTIRWGGADTPVWMTGPAVTVFEGEIEIS